MKMEYVNCNLCGSDKYEVHLIRGDLNLFLDGEFRLVKCAECGLVYLNPRPSVDEMLLLYTDDYDQFTIVVSDEPSILTRLERYYGLYKRCRSILHYQQYGRLLDIGCATGDFLAAMRKHPGWELYGIEPNMSASEYARSQLGLDVRTGTLDEVEFPEKWFDVVTLWNTIEHLSDPLGTLRKIHGLLKPQGIVVFSTPNLDSLDARLFGPYWIGYELPRHLYVFSRRTIRMLVTEAGFSILKIQCLYGSYAAAMSSVRFWLRAMAKDARWRGWAERLLFTRPLRLLTLPFFFVNDRLGLSSGITVFCRKVGE